MPADVNAAFSSLITTMLTPWPGDEVIAVAVTAYICFQYWNEISKAWVQICQVVGEAVGGLWEDVESEFERIQRTLENKKTKTDSFDIAWELQSKKEDPTPIICKIKYKHGQRKFKKSFIFVANVDAIQKPGKPKPKVELEMTLWHSEEEKGAYKVIKKETIDLVNYSKNYELVIPAKTGHYKLYCNIKPITLGDRIINLTELNSRYWCINRTGHIWYWNYVDKDAPAPKAPKKVTPPPATYKREKHDDREPSVLNYIKDYANKYNVQLQWPKNTIDIHHIRPLFCGGYNDFDNLIHLPKKHHGHITDWFKGYF